MSRSRRKRPIRGNTKSKSEKKDKAISHRRTRARERAELLRHHDESTPPIYHREVTDPWNMDKDGKKRFDPDLYGELMRK